MKRYISFSVILFGAVISGALFSGVSYAASPLGDFIKGGIVVALDYSDGQLVSEVAANKKVVVHGLVQSDAELNQAREVIKQKKLYGRVSFERYDGKALPYIDNLINVVMCKKSAVGSGQLAEEELMRVLAPGGVLMVQNASGWKKTVKPWPKGMDDWNQFLHGADNNGVSLDNVGTPQRMRWCGSPLYGRSKSISPSFTSMVSENGIIFTIEDRATTEDINAPVEYTLVARDAFNGIELWKRKMKKWDQWQAFSIKYISTQQQRSLAAIGDYVYCCTEYGGPLTVYAAKTGERVRAFEDTEKTMEFAIEGNVLYGVKGARYNFKGSSEAGNVELYALDLDKGSVMWKKVVDSGYTGGSMAVKGARLVYHSKSGLSCLDSATGRDLWMKAVVVKAPPPVKKEKDPRESKKKKGKKTKETGSVVFDSNTHPTIVITDEMVFSSINTILEAVWLKDGSTAWTDTGGVNYKKSPDLFVANRLVWGNDLNGRDMKTGKVVQKLTQQVTGPMTHDRCYRNRITHRYYLNSASGGTDFLKLDGTEESPNPWARSTCGLAVMPAYGMMYNGPYVCQCAIGTMIPGINGLYNGMGDTGKRFTVKIKPRLIKGSAFGDKAAVDATSSDWSTYRYSGERSAVSGIVAPTEVTQKWKVKIGSHATAPVIAGGHVYVADRDGYTLYALDRITGKIRWSFTGGGRIDSPPTYYKGLILFGSRCGWAYCLRASDGQMVWKFNGMPERRLICDTGRLESAWPVNGSIIVKDETAYFAAGRGSFLDGGIAMFGLDPFSGKMKHGKILQGPYQGKDRNFPVEAPGTFNIEGFKSGILSSAGDELFIRHQPFSSDLTPIKPEGYKTLHLMASAGFLNDSPQHRTYWTVDKDLRYGGSLGKFDEGPGGDTIAFDGKRFYEVRGYAPGRNLEDRGRNFNPASLYSIFSGELVDESFVGKKDAIPTAGKWSKRWEVPIPFAGHAVAVSKNTAVVAGVPMLKSFTQEETNASYAGNKGGVAWLLDNTTGERLQEMKLDAAPTWDGIAIAHNNYFITLKDGSVVCFSGK